MLRKEKERSHILTTFYSSTRGGIPERPFSKGRNGADCWGYSNEQDTMQALKKTEERGVVFSLLEGVCWQGEEPGPGTGYSAWTGTGCLFHSTGLPQERQSRVLCCSGGNK